MTKTVKEAEETARFPTKPDSIPNPTTGIVIRALHKQQKKAQNKSCTQTLFVRKRCF